MINQGPQSNRDPVNGFTVMVVFLAGVALGPIAWWQDNMLILALLALPALIPFFIHLRKRGE